MALESPFNYIDDLVETNPNNDPDQVQEAANHLRGIKSSTKGSFPNLGQGAVTGNFQDLNMLTGLSVGGTLTLFDVVYPVGSLYLSASAVDPGTLFGGTWTAIQDSFLVGAGGTYTTGDTGGSSDAVVVDHTHTDTFAVDSDGAHTHDIDSFNDETTGAQGNKATSDGVTPITEATQSDGAHTHVLSGSITNAGVSGVDANLPPYLAVHIWERTA